MSTLRKICLIGISALLPFSLTYANEKFSTTSPICVELNKRINVVNASVSNIYTENANVYGSFIRVLTIDDLHSAADHIQQRLNDVYQMTQQVRTQLQDIYGSICSERPNPEDSEE